MRTGDDDAAVAVVDGDEVVEEVDDEDYDEMGGGDYTGRYQVDDEDEGDDDVYGEDDGETI